MTAPIDTALDAAAAALMTPADREHADAHHGGRPGPGHRAQARRCIAAFLRGLPAAPDGKTILFDAKRLAAAVEAADADPR